MYRLTVNTVSGYSDFKVMWEYLEWMAKITAKEVYVKYYIYCIIF